jgi:hypothetical protein
MGGKPVSGGWQNIDKSNIFDIESIILYCMYVNTYTKVFHAIP